MADRENSNSRKESTPIVIVDHLRKIFNGKVTAVDDVSFNIDEAWPRSVPGEPSL